MIGYIAVLFNILSFSAKTTKLTLIFSLIATVLYGINVYFLGLILAFQIAFIGAFITLAALMLSEKIKNIIIILSPFIGLILFFNLNQYDLNSIMPLFGLFFATIAKMQKDIIKMKFYFLGCALSWLTLGLSIGKIDVILFDLVGVIVLISSISYLKIKKQ